LSGDVGLIFRLGLSVESYGLTGFKCIDDVIHQGQFLATDRSSKSTWAILGEGWFVGSWTGADEGDVEAAVARLVFAMFDEEEFGAEDEFALFGFGDGEDAILVDIARATGFDFDEDQVAFRVQGDDIDFAEGTMPAGGEDLAAFGGYPLGD
jgi:hypothetical protein